MGLFRRFLGIGFIEGAARIALPSETFGDKVEGFVRPGKPSIRIWRRCVGPEGLCAGTSVPPLVRVLAFSFIHTSILRVLLRLCSRCSFLDCAGCAPGVLGVWFPSRRFPG